MRCFQLAFLALGALSVAVSANAAEEKTEVEEAQHGHFRGPYARQDSAAKATPGITAALACVSISVLAYLVAWHHMRAIGDQQQHQAQRKRHLDKAVLESEFPVQPRLARSGTVPECVVCLDTIQEGDECRVLHCGHVFHAECVMEWWTHAPRRTADCPLCRQDQHVAEPPEAASAPVMPAGGPMLAMRP
uniref:RING-type domain-containing protein n=1 Tax=Zooxanthella nutricula TaxID=1333877 RepID=A0A7S2KS81_9DINO